jgi:hypothetical protein
MNRAAGTQSSLDTRLLRGERSRRGTMLPPLYEASVRVQRFRSIPEIAAQPDENPGFPRWALRSVLKFDALYFLMRLKVSG